MHRSICWLGIFLLLVSGCGPDDPNLPGYPDEGPGGDGGPVASFSDPTGCDPTYVGHDAELQAWRVLPTGDIDTANLQCALDEAVVAGAGTTVELVEGSYTTDVIEVVGFDGWLRGAGQEVTVLQGVEKDECIEPGQAGYPGLLFFRGGYARVASLGIDLAWSGCSGPGYEPGPGARPSVAPIIVTGAECVEGAPSHGSSLLQDVEFLSGRIVIRPAEEWIWLGEGQGEEGYDICRASGLEGDHRMTGLVGGSPYIWGVSAGTVTLGGSCEEGNTFYGPVFIEVTGEASAIISHNRFLLSAAFQASLRLSLPSDEFGPPGGAYRIARNHLSDGGRMYSSVLSVSGTDPEGEVDLIIEGNVLSKGDRRGGFVGFRNLAGGIFRENVLSFGERWSAPVSLGASRGWQIVDNELRSSETEYGTGPVYSVGEGAVDTYLRVSEETEVADDGQGTVVEWVEHFRVLDAGRLCLEAVFHGARGNSWWVEVQVDSPEPIARVLAYHGLDTHELSPTDWGSFAASFHAPEGSAIRFRAIAENGQAAMSVVYDWPAAQPADPDAVTLWADFFNPRGNENWAEIEVVANEPLAGVYARVDGGPWQPLRRMDWGSYAEVVSGPAGSEVRFRAVSFRGEAVVSASYSWPDATPIDDPLPPDDPPDDPPPDDFAATFFGARGNDWWVEIQVSAGQEIDTVHARVADGRWRELNATDWGSWARSFYVEPGSLVQFRARSIEGAEALSGRYLWPDAVLVDPDPDPGPDPDPDQFEARFFNVRGNSWWVETDVDGSHEIEGVDARVNGGEWIALDEMTWGSWAASFFVDAGSVVEFRAVSAETGATVISDDGYTWPP